MQGDFHHWVDLFNHFDTFFEKYIKPRKDLQLEDNFLESDLPFPRDAVLQILRVIRVILENCTNKHFYSSYEVYVFSCSEAYMFFMLVNHFVSLRTADFTFQHASLNLCFINSPYWALISDQHHLM